MLRGIPERRSIACRLAEGDSAESFAARMATPSQKAESEQSTNTQQSRDTKKATKAFLQKSRQSQQAEVMSAVQDMQHKSTVGVSMQHGKDEYNRGNYDGALHHWTVAKDQDASHLPAYTNCVMACMQLGRLDDAERFAREGVQKSKGNNDNALCAKVHYRLGQVLDKKGDFVAAAEAFAKARSIDPEGVGAQKVADARKAATDARNQADDQAKAAAAAGGSSSSGHPGPVNAGSDAAAALVQAAGQPVPSAASDAVQPDVAATQQKRAAQSEHPASAGGTTAASSAQPAEEASSQGIDQAVSIAGMPATPVSDLPVRVEQSASGASIKRFTVQAGQSAQAQGSTQAHEVQRVASASASSGKLQASDQVRFGNELLSVRCFRSS